MDKGTIITKDLHGHTFSVLSSGKRTALFDTVPACYARQWLDSAPDAEILILCSANPYPKCVQSFLEAHPDGMVYAAPYTAHILAAILGEAFSCTWVRDNTTVQVGNCKVSFTTVSQRGKGAYLIADAGDAGTVSGKEPQQQNPATEYTKPTVGIVFVSGCNSTEAIAERIADGILDSRDLDAALIDLAVTDSRTAVAALKNTKGILVGTPCIDGDAHPKVWELLTHLNRFDFDGKPAAVFGTYTWNNDAVGNIAERLRQLKLAVFDNSFTQQYEADSAALSAAYEYGYNYGCVLQNKPNTHSSKLVRCPICGEIFDAALGICPVCKLGADKCVPVEEEAVGYACDTDRTYLIAGGGIASLSAAEAIRKRDKTGKIVIVSAEDSLPINRTMLSKNMAVAAQEKENIIVKPAQWFEDTGVSFWPGTSVNAIDAIKKTATFNNGKSMKYDKLIYAMGAKCIIPNIPGKDLPGVFAIRSINDLQRLWSGMARAKKAVVIGGGVLGLEMASELRKMRLSVTVLESMPKIMARQLDDETAQMLVESANDCGVKVVTDAVVSKITGHTSVSGVALANGTMYPADIVIISCGSAAVTDVAMNTGITCRRAVCVTERMETSVADIYACGDCAELEGVNYQLWPEAAEQGRVAGANAAGDDVKYSAVPYGTSFEGMNIKLFSIGTVVSDNKNCKLLEYRNEIEGSFRKYWFVDGRLCGGVLWGNTDKAQILTSGVIRQSAYPLLCSEL